MTGNKRSVQKQLFLSFLALTMMLSFLVSLFSYIISFDLVKRRISESFSLTLDYISSGISADLNTISNLTDYIFTNQEIKDAIAVGTGDTLESIELNYAAAEAIEQYTISQFYEDVNRITIIGFNGYMLQNIISYIDVVDDGMDKYYISWSEQAITARGQCVWSDIISRKLNPNREDSIDIKEAVLFRTIKNSKYTEDIGIIYVSINSRLFLDKIQNYGKDYPDYANCSIQIVDNAKNILNAEDSVFSADELSEILGSKAARETAGYTVAAHNCVAYVKQISNGWSIVGTIPTSLFTAGNTYLFFMTLIAFFLCIIVCGLIWLYVSSGIFRPIHSIGETMKQIANGNTSLRIRETTEDELGQLGHNLNNMLEHIDMLHATNLENELKMRDALHRARQAQINPHFIYNTLNSIRLLAVMVNADSIKNAIDAFWVIAKYSTNSCNDFFALVGEEVEIVKKYIYLQKLSYVNKFSVQWDIAENVLDCECIRFFLQPLVENAIIHGAFPKEGECTIFISIYSEGEQLVFNVYDNGIGMDETTLGMLRKQADGTAGSGSVGLSNIFERLRNVYKDRCVIDIFSQSGHYTNIMIKTPLIFKAEDNEE